MNEDLEFFLIVLALFYLYDAIYWLRPGSVLFRSQFGEPHRLLGAFRHALLQNDQGGFLLSNLLPLGTAAQAQFWPVSLSPVGVLAYVSQAHSSEGRPEQPGGFFNYDDIRTVRADGSLVRINDQRFVTVCSPELALRLARLIEKLCALPEDRRADEIDAALAEATDLAAVTKRYRRAWWDSLLLLVLCSTLFVYIFVGVPLAVTYRLEWPWWKYLYVYFCLSLLIMVEYARLAAHTPGHEGSLWGQCLLILLFPPSAMHARNHLFRRLLAPYHPVVIAKVLCDAAEYREYAEQVVRDLEYPLEPICPVTTPGAGEVEAWFRPKLATRLKTVIEEAGVSVPASLSPPGADDSACLSYCQRCLTRFEVPSGTCHLCQERPLTRLPERLEPQPVTTPREVAVPVATRPVLPPPAATIPPVVTRREKKKRKKR